MLRMPSCCHHVAPGLAGPTCAQVTKTVHPPPPIYSHAWCWPQKQTVMNWRYLRVLHVVDCRLVLAASYADACYHFCQSRGAVLQPPSC
jgi:hypothetical protein